MDTGGHKHQHKQPWYSVVQPPLYSLGHWITRRLEVHHETQQAMLASLSLGHPEHQGTLGHRNWCRPCWYSMEHPSQFSQTGTRKAKKNGPKLSNDGSAQALAVGILWPRQSIKEFIPVRLILIKGKMRMMLSLSFWFRCWRCWHWCWEWHCLCHHCLWSVSCELSPLSHQQTIRSGQQ